MGKLTVAMKNCRLLAEELIALLEKLEFEADDLTFITGSKTTAQLRRKSMDLSDELVKLRKPYGEQ